MGMKFCPLCDACMVLVIKDDAVIYTCACGKQIPGVGEDACIYSKDLIVQNTNSYGGHQVFIKTAAYDPTINTIAKKCANCGRDYMASVHVSDNMHVSTICKCN
jgi:DNA-directed RNA polymerase subunit M/transcription elongation factor TFIIS